jgi:hypothetical protein
VIVRRTAPYIGPVQIGETKIPQFSSASSSTTSPVCGDLTAAVDSRRLTRPYMRSLPVTREKEIWLFLSNPDRGLFLIFSGNLKNFVDKDHN